MTVAELIEMLKQAPQDALVLMDGREELFSVAIHTDKLFDGEDRNGRPRWRPGERTVHLQSPPDDRR